jgi:sulfite reductase alpha subunit-like flavoprotein
MLASQMGTSRRAAEAFCDEAATRLTASAIQDMTGTDLDITATPTLMTLDAFLEEKEAAWTRIIVIFVSSCGMGDPPKGGWRFRDFCDALPMSAKAKNMLTGLKFAICGLGNASFRTYMQNPTAIEEGLRAAGATRIGEFCQGDAEKKGDESQKNTIIRWQEGMWKILAEALVEEPLTEERLAEMQKATQSLK